MKRCISVLLAALMLTGLFSGIAFAEDKPSYNIVAIGDSTTNGFNLDDYGYYSDATFVLDNSYNAYGILELASKDSYPYRMQRYLQSQMPDTEVTVTNLAVRGMRSDEIRKILDPSFENDDFGKYFMSELDYAFPRCFGISDATEFYTEKIASAQLITLDCCMNNFSNYLVDRLIAYMNGAPLYTDSASDLAGKLPPEATELIEGYIVRLCAAFSDVLPEGMVKELADAIGYCYSDFCVNFSAIIRILREINPDARIIVCGTFNPLVGLKVEYNGIEIDIGSLTSSLLGLVDTYMTALDPNRDSYSFAKAPEMESFMTVLAEADSSEDLSQVLFERIVTSIYHRRQMKLLDKMNEKIFAEAAAKGIDMGDMELVNDTDVFAAYENVRSGKASERDMLLYDINERLINKFLAAARIDCVDLTALLGALNGDINVMAVDMMDIPFEDLDAGQRAVLKLVDLTSVAEGIGLHPSYKGCLQKYEAVKKAYDENKPASAFASDVARESGINAGVAVVNAIKNPILNAIDRLFDRIGLSDLFAAIARGLENILLIFTR